MNGHVLSAVIMTFTLLLVIISVNGITLGINVYGSTSDTEEFLDSFNLNDCDLASTGANDYFILEPGYQLILEGEEDGEKIEVKITVLDETKMVNGTEARVIEEVETEDGKVVEISKNWFVVCEPRNDIFYLGEDVDIYEDEKIINHEGAWQAGVNDAKLGLIMPGKVELGFKHYQEIAPGVAEDRAEIVALSEELETPAANFKDVLKVEETTPLEPDEKSYKFYAPGIGLVQDDTLRLVKFGNVTSN